jgi:hypothetical protein
MSADAAMFGVEIGDPDATRTVIAIVVLLLVMGVALVMLALWQRRETRPDPTFLAPLELMGERQWRRGDPVWQRRRLDEVRPEGAEPLQKAAAPPSLDEAFDAGPSGSGFDDLRPDEQGPDEQAVVEPPEHEGDGTVVDATVSDSDLADDETAAREWPPRPPMVGTEGAPADRDDADEVVGPEPPTSGAPTLFDDVPHDEQTEEAGERDEEGRTPLGSRRPWLDLPERDIDPDALRRAMEELDAELGGSTGDA